MKQVHILNGDSLKSQLPTSISGEILVARECLIDGDVQGETLADFFSNRARFIESYPQVVSGAYLKGSVPEFEKIMAIAKKSDIYCWFEEDLFCQLNFWFVLYLLAQQDHDSDIYFVRPNTGNEFSFANMSQTELMTAHQQATIITRDDFKVLAKFWPCYQQANYDEMLVLAKQLASSKPSTYRFLIATVNAQVERMPDESGYGRPQRTLLKLMTELDTSEFGPIFTAFSQSEAIYSFGDLQVKRMLAELLLAK